MHKVLPTATADLLARLRASDVAGADDPVLAAEWAASGVKFVASAPAFTAQYRRALGELFSCIEPIAGCGPILNEGGIYYGCWLESTGTINAELLARFLPSVAGRTFSGFAAHQRADGLFPYKLTEDGPVFSQIQLVSPLARSVWTHYRLSGDKALLEKLYPAMARYDAWLAKYRDTRGSGGVEAFCTYDTGHDLSARFWHVPDSPLGNDPTRYNPDNPLLPFIAPDLTANVACQRRYLALIAEELDEDSESWRQKAKASEQALFTQCYDADDGFFYDRDRHDRLVRVQSDVLLRVLACEVGDDAFFASALERYLLNTRKFFARFPFTSMALDEPRYDPAFDYNSWSGPTNFLSLIRSPHAFEAHERHVELTFAIYPTLAALFTAPRFAQTLSPFTGKAGFTEAYSPSILCLLDFVERLCGIQPRPDDTLWFTGLLPYQMQHRDVSHATAYARNVDKSTFELVNTPETIAAFRDGEILFTAPKGVRVVTDREGRPAALVGMSVNEIEGVLSAEGGEYRFRIGANERHDLVAGQWRRVREPGFIAPAY